MVSPRSSGFRRGRTLEGCGQDSGLVLRSSRQAGWAVQAAVIWTIAEPMPAASCLFR